MKYRNAYLIIDSLITGQIEILLLPETSSLIDNWNYFWDYDLALDRITQVKNNEIAKLNGRIQQLNSLAFK